jgi:hypothetical protein
VTSDVKLSASHRGITPGGAYKNALNFSIST